MNLTRPSAALFALALIAAGCGDDDAEPATSGEAGQTQSETSTADNATDEAAAEVSFVAPENGATVARRFPLTMQADGIDIEPAGEVREGAGHFHVMVDADCVPAGETIPKDDQHIHFGDGSTAAELDLAPGAHSLCLQLGDGAHIASPLTHTVSVTVV